MAQNPAPQPALSWSIVGQGAIGLLAACRMQQAGFDVSLWLRKPRLLTIKFAHRQLQFQPASAPISAVLIPVKSYAVTEAVQTLLPAMASDAQLVLSHNGMGTIEQVKPMLAPGHGLWFLTTTHGALKQPDAVLHTGTGSSTLAALNNAAKVKQQQVLQAMDIALGPVTLTGNIQPALWQKLAINAVINPLTALYNCRNGELAAQKYHQHIEALVTEVCKVAAACGYPMSAHSTLQTVLRVISSTAQNFSSMQQDLAHGRRTEIDAITGYVVQQAAHHNISVPHNQTLLEQILLRQQQRY
ncbi:2-dehydropantoate 2-reductase [Rheinheimera sp.]|uniref:ketopantoate reductase family protein n=1 Tax=Rheinheimera sp. TaxID=1869214 RepID=UPI002355D148|nr:2-dehydropantoate 2-reductase [Rheinheimera sp.]